MLINVYNNGQTEPTIQLTGKYLNATSIATPNSDDGLYLLSRDGIALLKVEINGVDANLLAAKTKVPLFSG